MRSLGATPEMWSVPRAKLRRAIETGWHVVAVLIVVGWWRRLFMLAGLVWHELFAGDKGNSR